MAFADYTTQAKDDAIITELAPHVRHHSTSNEVIAGRPMEYQVFCIKQYVVVVTSCTSHNIAYATCNCIGFYYKTRCKHTHYSILKR